MSASGGEARAEEAMADDGHGAIRPREGSTLHYALLWTKPAARERFLARLALIRTLARTLDDVNDPGVAERKVHWWHEELARLAGGAPRHPRTVACADSLAGDEAATAALLDVLSVAATTRYTPPSDDLEWHARLARDHGARLALLAHALGEAADDLADPAVRHTGLATGLGLHETLSRLPALLHRGFAVFPDATYRSHGLNPAALARHVRREGPDGARLGGIPVVTDGSGDTDDANGAVDAKRRAIVAASVDAASTALEGALTDPDHHAAYSREARAPIARLAALRARKLRLWREQRPDLLRETVTPTPLAKFLVAWRHRRGARRPRQH